MLQIIRSFSTHINHDFGFIGVGLMGSHMSRNLMKSEKLASSKFTLCDNDAVTVDNMKKTVDSKRCSFAKLPMDVASQAHVIFTMLPHDEIVKHVYLGHDGLIKNLSSKHICIDSSTISPQTSQTIAKALAEKGSIFIDAPVSGGVPGARDATLCFMVGGPAEVVKRIEPYIIPAMGRKLFHCGDEVGSGLIAKLCNNMLLAICMIGTSEALHMGQKLGLDAKVLTNILNASTGQNWCSSNYNPVPGVLTEGKLSQLPSNNDYKDGFRVSLMCKDLKIGQNLANDNCIDTPLGSLAHQIYKLLNAHAKSSQKDFALVYPYLSGQLFKSDP